eukprot:g1547.t1
MGICTSKNQFLAKDLSRTLTFIDGERRKVPKFRKKASIKRFQNGLSKGFATFNNDLRLSVAMDTSKVQWHHGPHCMNCYLGQEHTCWDPTYAKEMDNILRKVLFVKNAHKGGFELSKKKTGKGNDYAVITYIVRYAPNTPELPHHDHPHGEEYFVLEGSFDDHNGELGFMPAPKFSYIKYPHNTDHHAQPNKELGCTVLTWWGQNDNGEEAAPLPWWKQSHPKTTAKTVQKCNTWFRDPEKDESSPWRKSKYGPGMYELELFRSTGPSKERTWMLHVPKRGVSSISVETEKVETVPENDLSLINCEVKDRAVIGVHRGGLEAFLQPLAAQSSQVPVIQWDPTRPFADFVKEQNQPIVLRNSIVTTWPATKWSPEHLADLLGHSLVYANRSKNNGIFGPYYAKHRPMHHIEEVRKAHLKGDFRDVIEISGKDFFSKLQGKCNKNNDSCGDQRNEWWWYLSQEIEKFGVDLEAQVHPFTELLRIGNTAKTSINIWAGTAGVQTPCHFDGYHNFFVHLYGEKLFTIFSPDNQSILKPFPFLHPLYAQCSSSIPVSQTRLEEEHKYQRWKILLQPGDLLYIPPLYFHETEAVTSSISVNFWSGVTEEEIAQELIALQTPISRSQHIFEEERSNYSTVTLAVLVWSVVKKVMNGNIQDTILFFKQFLLTRYSSKVLAELGLTSASGHLCETSFLSQNIGELIEKMNRIEVAPYLKQVKVLVQRFHPNDVTNDRRNIWLFNFIEHIAAQHLVYKASLQSHFNKSEMEGFKTGIRAIGSFVSSIEACTRFIAQHARVESTWYYNKF